MIELMIVVAIIGILASLALPDFMKMIAKTKQSEAQANLAAIYTGQMVYWGTNGVFAGKADLQGKDAFAQIGFKTESEAVIKYTYIMDEAVLPGKVDLPYLPTAFESSATSFTAIAVSNVDTDATLDIWTVDNDRTFRNALNDVKF